MLCVFKSLIYLVCSYVDLYDHYMHGYVHVYVCVYMYICVYIYVCICMCMCMHNINKIIIFYSDKMFHFLINVFIRKEIITNTF